jgi:hypothetical protein
VVAYLMMTALFVVKHVIDQRKQQADPIITQDKAA